MHTDLLKALGVGDDPKQIERLRASLQRELAQKSLIDFAETVSPWFEKPRHIHYLAGLLEKVERGEIKRLAISIAPGHGKSTLLQHFIAWFLGRDPKRRILALSASESLAQRNSRATRGIIASDEWPWPNVKLEGTAIEEWYVNQGGGVRSIGRTGTVTGFRAEMILVDDVQPDAGSEATRENDEEWFRGVLSTRLEPNGVVVFIQTRWRDDDLIGRIQEGPSASQWTIVNIPVIAGDGDPLKRKRGEALWPERWSVELMQLKREEVGPSAFSAQYMGDPIPAEGRIFQPEWFDNRYDALPRQRYAEPTQQRGYAYQLGMASAMDPLPPIVIQACDSAWREGLTNDRSVIATLVSDMRDIYVADVWFGRAAYPDLRRIVQEVYAKHKPRTLYVEEAQSGYALVSDLRTTTGIPIVGVNPGRESKEARAESVTGLFESGRIKFPKNASWMGELLNEFLRFPGGRHDDIVDAVVLGIRQMQLAIQQQVAYEQTASQVDQLQDWMMR